MLQGVKLCGAINYIACTEPLIGRGPLVWHIRTSQHYYSTPTAQYMFSSSNTIEDFSMECFYVLDASKKFGRNQTTGLHIALVEQAGGLVASCFIEYIAMTSWFKWHLKALVFLISGQVLSSPIHFSHLPEPSGHAVHGYVDELDVGGQHGWWLVLLHHTHRLQGKPYPFV